MKYFIPEWDDQVDSGYDFQKERYSENHVASRRKDAYMWEIFELERVPFDGVLVSLMSINDNERKKKEIQVVGGLHKYLRLPNRFQILADCGAWGYIKEEENGPPFDAVKVLELYKELGVQEAVTVDHLVTPRFKDNGKIVAVDTARRMRITFENGIKGFEIWKKKYRQDFNLLVSVQGLKLEDYLHMYKTYLERGVTSFAFGGLAKKPTKIAVNIVEELINNAKQENHRAERIHFFGLGRTNLFPKFKELEEVGVEVSFDTASWLRRAWLGGEYYLIDSGKFRKYTAIRVPMTDTERSSFKGKRRLGLDADILGLEELETECLNALRSFECNKAALEQTFLSIQKFDAKLLEELEKSLRGKTEDPVERHRKTSSLRRFFRDLEKSYEETLRDRPWTKCDCPICKNIGIEVVLFRGNDRNRRRGFHNVFTIYHKLLGNPELWKLSFDIDREMRNISPEGMASLTGKVLVITGCTKTKIGYDSKVKAKAKDMYQGRLFKVVTRYSEVKKFPLVIISAKYGLISPDDVIEGYEKVLRTTGDVEQIRPKINEQLSKILPQFEKVLVIAGQMYRKALKDVWDDKFVSLKASGYADFCKIMKQIVLKTRTPELLNQ